MVRLVLTLVSGVQIEVHTDQSDAYAVLDMIRRAWADGHTTTDLTLGTGGEVTDWVRLAHISAVQILPATEDGTSEEGTDAAG